jgi:hypothetical protein
VQLALQAMIVLTGNYTFFNLLTATLAVLHLDDEALPWGAAGALLATGARVRVRVRVRVRACSWRCRR